MNKRLMLITAMTKIKVYPGTLYLSSKKPLLFRDIKLRCLIPHKSFSVYISLKMMRPIQEKQITKSQMSTNEHTLMLLKILENMDNSIKIFYIKVHG